MADFLGSWARTGNGTLSGVGVVHLNLLAFSGKGTFQTSKKFHLAALSGSGTLGNATKYGSRAFTGTGTLRAIINFSGTRDFSGTGTLTTNLDIARTRSFSGSGQLGTSFKFATRTFSGSGTLAGVRSAIIGFSGTGTLLSVVVSSARSDLETDSISISFFTPELAGDPQHGSSDRVFYLAFSPPVTGRYMFHTADGSTDYQPSIEVYERPAADIGKPVVQWNAANIRLLPQPGLSYREYPTTPEHAIVMSPGPELELGKEYIVSVSHTTSFTPLAAALTWNRLVLGPIVDIIAYSTGIAHTSKTSASCTNGTTAIWTGASFGSDGAFMADVNEGVSPAQVSFGYLAPAGGVFLSAGSTARYDGFWSSTDGAFGTYDNWDVSQGYLCLQPDPVRIWAAQPDIFEDLIPNDEDLLDLGPYSAIEGVPIGLPTVTGNWRLNGFENNIDHCSPDEVPYRSTFRRVPEGQYSIHSGLDPATNWVNVEIPWAGAARKAWATIRNFFADNTPATTMETPGPIVDGTQFDLDSNGCAVYCFSGGRQEDNVDFANHVPATPAFHTDGYELFVGMQMEAIQPTQIWLPQDYVAPTGGLKIKLEDGSWADVMANPKFRLKSEDGTWWQGSDDVVGARELRLKLNDGSWVTVTWMVPV